MDLLLSFLLLTVCCNYICHCVSSVTTISAATDTLIPSQKLKDGQTLVSANRRFELGFFSKKRLRYLGMWYKDVAPLTVLWVANRTKPLKIFGATLILDIKGGLAIQDHTHRDLVVLSKPDKTAGKPVLQLLDSGNLVLRDSSVVSDGGFIWQSFDYPCDTLLPGMKIGRDYKTGRNKKMRSWKDRDDPSVGDFTFVLLDGPELAQLVLERNSVKQSRWGPWDGVQFSGSNGLGTNSIIHPVFTANANGVYFTFDLVDDSVLVRLVVTQWGKVQFVTWKNVTREWIQLVTLNKDSCDGYGTCGPYGICYVDEPNCQCLKGFKANSSGDWSKMDWTGGCKRNFKLKCGDGDGFLQYKGLKLPDNATVWANLDSIECEKKCLQECSCMAYAYLDVYGNGNACVVWLNDLYDMRSFPQGGDDVFIRMARGELEAIASAKMDKRHIFIIVILTSAVTGIALLCFLIGCCICMRRQARRKNNLSILTTGSPEENIEFRHFDIGIIFVATNNFSETNKIGQGGFGPVYKGELPNGQQIAVKRLSRSSRQGIEQFENESSLIARLQHRNLVKLLGCCVHEEERILIYEYLLNKSLDNFIFDQARKRLLPWAKRFDIILGVAKGMVYLHDDSGLRIVHRDLKAGNILLDIEMTPKISDFGLAKILGEDNESEEASMRLIGTYGYMSPEYARHGQFSTKSDVFSFGVLVLEIISGQKNWGFHHPDHDLNLLGHGWNLWRQGKALELVDSALEDSFSETEVLRCFQVGLLCAQNRPEDRPEMSTTIYLLGNESMKLPEPVEPGFFPGSSSMWPNSAGSPLSVNGLTITTLSAR